MTLKTTQQALLAAGYPIGKDDGIWGPKTEKAVMDLIEFNRKMRGATAPAEKTGPIPIFHLPNVPMKRIHCHWTGGAYTASDTDKEHYHFLIEQDLDIIKGKHSIAANVNVSGKSPDDYAAHTLNANSGAVGLALCCMGGAIESPFHAGRFPMTAKQFNLLVEVIRQLCAVYDIPVTPTTVLTHAEVQDNLGIQQRGKWDYTRLPFLPNVVGAKAVGDYLRARVAEERL